MPKGAPLAEREGSPDSHTMRRKREGKNIEEMVDVPDPLLFLFFLFYFFLFVRTRLERFYAFEGLCAPFNIYHSLYMNVLGRVYIYLYTLQSSTIQYTIYIYGL